LSPTIHSKKLESFANRIQTANQAFAWTKDNAVLSVKAMPIAHSNFTVGRIPFLNEATSEVVIPSAATTVIVLRHIRVTTKASVPPKIRDRWAVHAVAQQIAMAVFASTIGTMDTASHPAPRQAQLAA
jgi:hypothetical protein